MGDFLSQTGDYWCFVLIALGCFAVVAAGLRRKRPRAHLSRAFWLSLTALLIAGYFYVEAADRRPQQRLIALLEGIALTYAVELTRMGHAELRVETAANDPRYLAMIEAQRRWVLANSVISDIHTFRRGDDGRVMLLVDAETDYDGDGIYRGEHESRTTPGTIYAEAGPELLAAFDGVGNFTRHPVTDRFGTWVSVHVPMRDATGRVEAVLGVDYRADLWQGENAERRLVAMGYLAMVLSILLGSGASIAVYRSELAARVEAEGRLRAGLVALEHENAGRRAAERARLEADARLALHVEQTPLAYLEWGADLRVTRWNPAAERIFGYTEAEARGRLFTELIVPPSARVGVDEVCRRLAAVREPVKNTNENITKAGIVIVCEWHNTPLVDARGELPAVGSHAQDITERVRIGQHLRQGQKMESMGQLAGGVAHEFNNLLTPMLMQMGQVQAAYAGDHRLLEMLRPVEDAIMHAAQLNQRILAVGRRQPEDHTLGDLNRMIEAAVDLLRHTLDRRIELKINLQPGLPAALLSKGAITQVVMNLALNARDTLLEKLAAGAPPDWMPRLTIRTGLAVQPPTGAPERLRIDGPCVTLTIDDNGEGMSPELQRRIFEPFFTTKPVGQGTGLGLAVVWGVIEGLRGHLEVTSAPGAGSTFVVWIPAARRDAVSALIGAPMPRPAPPVATPSARLRVLLVEDNELVRDTLREVLHNAGHAVACANDGEAGWAALQAADGSAATGPFDLLITALNLPRLSGRDLLRRGRGLRLARDIIVLSGVVDARLGAELSELGVARVLHKPIARADLLAALDDLGRGRLKVDAAPEA